MGRSLTPKDVHALMNLLVKEATGQQSITVVDASTFVSAGELVLSTGMENVYNALNIVLGRTLVASRPYTANLKLMDALDTGAYTSRVRKISYYAKDALASGAFNTDLYTNFKDGFTAGDNNGQSTKSQWEQNPAVPLEMNFGGSVTWQDCYTIYEDAVKMAFRDETEFATFVAGYLTEHQNDIESQREAWNRLALLNHAAGTYAMSANMPGAVINLTKAFNDKFGTSYTSEELRTTYLKDFLAFFVAEFKKASKFMTERTVNYHWSPAKDGYKLLRHTPVADQRVYLYSPLFTDAEALVLPQIFNPTFLNVGQYQEVTYWQSVDDRASIKVKPAIIDTTTGQQKASVTEVDIPYVVGMITDKDALMTNFGVERVDTTVLEARKHFRNTWMTFLKNIMDDPTENRILFVMEDEVQE